MQIRRAKTLLPYQASGTNSIRLTPTCYVTKFSYLWLVFYACFAGRFYENVNYSTIWRLYRSSINVKVVKLKFKHLFVS